MDTKSNGLTELTISFTTIAKVLLALLAAYFFYSILDILGLLFVAVVVSAAFGPWVDWLHRYSIPRSVSVMLIYLFIFAFISLVIFLMVPPLQEQIGNLAASIPNYYGKLVTGISHWQGENTTLDTSNTVESLLNNLGSNLAGATSSIFATLNSIFGGIVQMMVILVISFYLIVQENGLKKLIRAVTPLKYQTYLIQTFHRINLKLGSWFRAQLVLMVTIGLVTYIALRFAGMEYALVLALWAGLTEIIPYIGPLIGAVPALFLAFAISPTLGLVVLIIYIVIQQLENNLLVPTIMKKAVGLNPVISIMVILIGAKLGGVLGAILSIPLATTVAVLLSDLFEDWKVTEQVAEVPDSTPTS